MIVISILIYRELQMEQKLQIIMTTTARYVLSNKQRNIQKIHQQIRHKAPTVEIDADVLENYPSFTADINIDETNKNIKQEEVFDKTINQLPPDNDTVYIDHDRKNNKFRVRLETSDKNTVQKSSRKKMRSFTQVLDPDIVGTDPETELKIKK